MQMPSNPTLMVSWMPLTCPSDYYSLNHCVQIVGFDTTKSSASYWIVKNSWGDSWGEDGYVRLEFGTNACGVADEATFVQA